MEVTFDVGTVAGETFLIGPAGIMPAGSVLAGAGGASAAIAGVGGVLGAGLFGYGIGSLIDAGITAALGKSLGESIYDWLYPEDQMPALDPLRTVKGKCPRVE
jgi:hypothetical protein